MQLIENNHSVNSSSHSVNGDIAIQWEWSNFDPSQNPNPLTDYDKTLHNWLRPRVEHVAKNLCKSAASERLAKCEKYKASYFLFFYFFTGSPIEVIHWWIVAHNSSNTRCDIRKCFFGVHTMADNIVGVQIPQTPSKIAFHKHVLASANGLETNDIIEDWRHWLCYVAACRSIFVFIITLLHTVHNDADSDGDSDDEEV